MQKQGEETPLDSIPQINDNTEMWFLNAYKNLKDLTGFEYHITISDFYHYFQIYPIPFQKTTVISVIKQIDRKIEEYQKKIHDAKNKNAVG